MLIETVAASSLSTVPSFTLKVKLSLVAVSDVLIYSKSVPESVLGKSSDVISVPPSLSVPLEGKVDTIYVNESPSGSVPANVIDFSVCSIASTVWAVATGKLLHKPTESIIPVAPYTYI